MDQAEKMLLEGIRKDIWGVRNLLIAQNGRVRKLENWRAGIVAIGGFMTFAVPVYFKFFN